VALVPQPNQKRAPTEADAPAHPARAHKNRRLRVARPKPGRQRTTRRASSAGCSFFAEVLFSWRERCDEVCYLGVAVVAHPIFLVSHGVFAFPRFMAVVSTLALTPILGHLVPRGILVCVCGNAPSSRPNEIQRAAASSQCILFSMSSAAIAVRQQASACLR